MKSPVNVAITGAAGLPLNFEMAATKEMLAIALKHKPHAACLVPEKREERTEGQEGRYHLAERRWGTFTRSFVLPRDVDADNIQASFEDGVLTVSIPKSEKARRRKIDVGGNVTAQQVGTGEQQNS